MIDLQRETLITLAEAAKLIPGRPSACSIWRWRTRGVKGRKLECVKIGGRAYTSLEAIARFGIQQGGTEGPLASTTRQRQRAAIERVEQAERELDDK